LLIKHLQKYEIKKNKAKEKEERASDVFIAQSTSEKKIFW
jgi:hypothetical protein